MKKTNWKDGDVKYQETFLEKTNSEVGWKRITNQAVYAQNNEPKKLGHIERMTGERMTKLILRRKPIGRRRRRRLI